MSFLEKYEKGTDCTRSWRGCVKRGQLFIVGMIPLICKTSFTSYCRSNTNDMSVNFSKTKEMVRGPPASTTKLPLAHCAEGQIERVNSFKLLSFKLLGLHLDADFS